MRFSKEVLISIGFVITVLEVTRSEGDFGKIFERVIVEEESDKDFIKTLRNKLVHEPYKVADIRQCLFSISSLETFLRNCCIVSRQQYNLNEISSYCSILLDFYDRGHLCGLDISEGVRVSLLNARQLCQIHEYGEFGGVLLCIWERKDVFTKQSQRAYNILTKRCNTPILCTTYALLKQMDIEWRTVFL